jgi:hypothetical protein
MPVHDWTRVSAGTFHDLHVAWISEIRNLLNNQLLPDGYYAQAEQVAGNTIPDVLTLQNPDEAEESSFESMEGSDDAGGNLAVVAAPPQTVPPQTAPPRTAIVQTLNRSAIIAPPQRRITIRHSSGDRVIALLEIVSPANKDRTSAIEQFVDKAIVAFSEGLHLQIIDLFPPNQSNRQGLHSLIWSRLEGHPETPPADKPLTLAAYNARTFTCFVEPTAVGKPLIDMPLFLTARRYVNVPLEQTYLAAYQGVPKRWKQVIEGH